MKRFAHLATPWWIGGVLLAGCGVALARFAPPAWQSGARVAGHLLALVGIFVIATGVSRRVNGGSAR